MWSDATTAIPSIEERLTSLERSMREMTGMLWHILNQSLSVFNISVPPLVRSVHPKATGSNEGNSFGPFLPNPVRLIQCLQSEFFGETSRIPVESPFSGNSFEKGILDSKSSYELVQLYVYSLHPSTSIAANASIRFVDNFGSLVSINSQSDFHNEIRNTGSLLYSTACLLASRYVLGIPPPILHAMNLQVRHKAVNLLWEEPPLKYKSLQALALLCLWPAVGQKEFSIDGWLLSGTVINHALVFFEFLNHVSLEFLINNNTASQL